MKVWSGTMRQFEAGRKFKIIDSNDVIIVDGIARLGLRMWKPGQLTYTGKELEGRIVVWSHRRVKG